MLFTFSGRAKYYDFNGSHLQMAFQVVLVVKQKQKHAKAGDVRDAGLIPELGRSPGERNGNLLHYFCLDIPL